MCQCWIDQSINQKIFFGGEYLVAVRSGVEVLQGLDPLMSSLPLKLWFVQTSIHTIQYSDRQWYCHTQRVLPVKLYQNLCAASDKRLKLKFFGEYYQHKTTLGCCSWKPLAVLPECYGTSQIRRRELSSWKVVRGPGWCSGRKSPAESAWRTSDPAGF